ncbi:MAG TPA: hypothetical protein VML56_12065 [Burkholderiales bacterium]|jgi:hypothetical protein|nr:hypothetical protein [Burkholderiales bacterium]
MSLVRKFGFGVIALTLSAGTALAFDQEQALREPNGSEQFVDAVVGRPLGLFALAVGAATWVVSLPFTLPSQSAHSAAKGLVADPAQWTFGRPLGKFVDCNEQPDMCR